MTGRFQRHASTAIVTPLALGLLIAILSVGFASWASAADAVYATGTIKGRFVHLGNPPEQEVITPNHDQQAFSQYKIVDESLIVDHIWGIQNVAIWIRNQDVPAPPPSKDPIVVEWKEGRIEPHMVGFQAPRDVLFKNSESVQSIVSYFPRGRSTMQGRPFSLMLMPQKDQTQNFVTPEIEPQPLFDQFHQWMNAWLLPLAHPYFSISNEGGEFKIENIPPGRWEFQVWHERTGNLQTDSWPIGRFTKDIAPGEVIDLGNIKLAPKLFKNNNPQPGGAAWGFAVNARVNNSGLTGPAEAATDHPPENKNRVVTINGWVFDADVQPLAGAKLYLAGQHGTKLLAEATSDAQGYYQFDNVPFDFSENFLQHIFGPQQNLAWDWASGSFQLFGRADGHAVAWRAVKGLYLNPNYHGFNNNGDEPADGPATFGSDDKITLDLQFPAATPLKGKIVDENGAAISGARIEIRSLEKERPTTFRGMPFRSLPYNRFALESLIEPKNAVPDAIKQRTTDANGHFEFADLPPNCRLSLQISADSFPKRQIDAATSDIHGTAMYPIFHDGMTVPVGHAVSVPIEVQLEDTDRPAAHVHICVGGNAGKGENTTDNQGRVKLDLPPGHYEVQLVPALGTPYLLTNLAAGFDVKSMPAGVQTAPMAVFKLKPAVMLKVNMVDADSGQPVPHMMLLKSNPQNPNNRESIQLQVWDPARNGQNYSQAITDEHGHADVPLEPSTYLFSVQATGEQWNVYPPNIQQEQKQIELKPGEPAEITFKLKKHP